MVEWGPGKSRFLVLHASAFVLDVGFNIADIQAPVINAVFGALVAILICAEIEWWSSRQATIWDWVERTF